MIASSHRATALAIAALAIPVLAADAAEARTVKPYYSETYETKGPARGYEGSSSPTTTAPTSATPIARAAPTRGAASAAASPGGGWSRPADRRTARRNVRPMPMCASCSAISLRRGRA